MAYIFAQLKTIVQYIIDAWFLNICENFFPRTQPNAILRLKHMVLNKNKTNQQTIWTSGKLLHEFLK